jgi:hypothetical protein
MSRKRKSAKVIRKYYRKIHASITTIKKQFLWLLRTFLVAKKRRKTANAGFVLPTVAMVSIVVVLLTVAIMFRSFERSKNASNVRVNQVVLNATAPAIDRARAKLNALSEDPTLPRGTPSDGALYDALKKDKYRFGDESRLKLAYDFNGISGIQKPGDAAPATDATDTNPRVDTIEEDETSKTAWRFAIDTDNNGRKDTFTLYGVNFRSPTRGASGEFNRKRNPLEARTPPMDNDATNQQCRNAAGFSTLVGNSSWYKLQNGNLGKSFFVYAVNIPITQQQMQGENLSTTEFEAYKGNKGFAAIEFQQDRSRVPLPNNAVWYENDLEITPGLPLALNGRVHTNGNLLIGGGGGAAITLRQVSSKTSCFYNQENGLITVGGNVGTGSVAQNANQADVGIHLYKGYGANPDTNAVINGANRSTDQAGGEAIGFNDNAYNQRIAIMKETAEGLCTQCINENLRGDALKQQVNASNFYPGDIKRNVSEKVKNDDDGKTAVGIIKDEIEVYLRNRTRRVPFAEVRADAPVATATTGFNASTFASSKFEPPQSWREPLDASNNLNNSTNPVVRVTTSQLTATFPDLQKQEGIQTSVGDRVLVGNNLPALWLQGNRYVGNNVNQMIAGVNWNRPGGADAKQRWRNTQIQAIDDLGISDRNGFWEEKAYERPVNNLDSFGGVRIITGAGIYRDDDRAGLPATTGVPVFPRSGTITAPNSPALITEPPRLSSNAVTSDGTVNNPPQFNGQANIYVWPDTMRMSSATNPASNAKGDLLMRATAFYHYGIDSGVDQEPIACISSYHDPTSATSIFNSTGLPWNTNPSVTPAGKSNNGIVYRYQGRTTLLATNRPLLDRQSRLVFPNGRIVNQPLRDALDKMNRGQTLQASDYSAIDTALCAIQILNNPTSNIAGGAANMPPHGAIREASFLDGREVKQTGKLTSRDFRLLGDSSTSALSLDLEQRQPLEIRTTDIDLGQLAATQVTGGEYLLPNSGIIYASRDDAMRDSSNNTTQSELLSPTDFRLDPTRRPNGIRLVNGATLARTANNLFNSREKGLILATNLPAYIRGPFNLHRASTAANAPQIEEFTQTSPANDADFYNRSTPNTDFACRRGRTGCPGGGDYWRPATIIADSMTLLSQDFRDGFRNESDFDLNNNTGNPVRDLTLSATPTQITTNPLPVNSTTNFDQSVVDRLRNGFLENSFVANADWWRPGTTGANTIYPRNVNLHAPSTNPLGSYALNGITPIQRRLNQVPLYVMEICRREQVSDCLPGDWSVGFDANGDGDVADRINFDVDRDGTVNTLAAPNADPDDVESAVKANQIGLAVIASGGNTANWNTAYTTAGNNKSIRERLGGGDTALPALEVNHRLFPRRVAFARNYSNNLVIDTANSNTYKPIGVGCPVRPSYTSLTPTDAEFLGNGCTYSTGALTPGTHYGILGDNGLWFRTVNTPAAIANPLTARYDANSLFYYPPIDTKNNATGALTPDGLADLDAQPILVPVTQIIDAVSIGNTLRDDDRGRLQHESRFNWTNIATVDTTYNATFVVGNSPGRPAEIAGGLQNFVRFLEAWRTDNSGASPGDLRTARISGSFIQLQRSKFATAPIGAVPRENTANTVNTSNIAALAGSLSIFDFPNDTYANPNGDGLLPFYWAPLRTWGFDVGLLSEQPDLFAQRFTQPQTGRPSEFFREVGRDDLWVQGLLCAGVASDRKGEATNATYQVRAAAGEYVPNNCPAIPAD